MRAHFQKLAEHVATLLSAGEAFTLWLQAENTDFVRFNHGKVRQAGEVRLAALDLALLRGQRQAEQSLNLSGGDDDFALLDAIVPQLRAALDDVADDPFLLINREPASSERVQASALPASAVMAADIAAAAAERDLVGLLASGEMMFGFANSLGQFNWQHSASWNFDWSVYAHGDKAVKCGMAGSRWSGPEAAQAIAEAAGQLAWLQRPPRTLQPGAYRAYFAPAALGALLSMLNWGGWSEKEVRSKRSPLLRLVEGQVRLSPLVTLSEANAAGLAPLFQQQGFSRPERVDLIVEGKHRQSLVSPRSASEFGLAGNGAAAWEAAESLEMAAGSLPTRDVLRALGTGVYVSNLWYLNFSDRAACRVTGMTRFACFWVEDGEIVAPLSVMRFDDSLYQLLGERLEALTTERTFMADSASYAGRSTRSQHLPGALVGAFHFSL
ncbi:hypothetical protein CEK28_05805 [Xenophilus sp. AP218F]|nr:hypothetical protein CEK28_05805 [Xenophilus sp. AP218F]